VEYDPYVTPLREEILTEGIEVREGYVDIPKKPGLGIEVNEDALEKYRVR